MHQEIIGEQVFGIIVAIFKPDIGVREDVLEAQKALAEAEFLVSRGQPDLAIKILRGFLSNNPTAKDVQIRLDELTLIGEGVEIQSPGVQILKKINTLLSAGNLTSVEQNTKELLRFFPKSPELWTILAKTYLALAKLDSAKEASDISCGLDPDYREALETNLLICERIGDHEAANVTIKHLIDVEPNNLESLSRLAKNLELLVRPWEAIDVYNDILLIDEKHLPSLLRLGNLYKSYGDFIKAKSIFEVLLSFYPMHVTAHRLLGNLKKYSTNDPQIKQMLNIYKRSKKDTQSRAELCFALGKAYEDLDDFKRAFKFITEGNRLKKFATKFEIAKTVGLFSQIKENFPAIKKIPLLINNACESPTPVFVVGMPRSGTTLVEQIITAHKDVASAGELDLIRELCLSVSTNQIETNEESLLFIRERYLDFLKKIASGKKFVVDKMPQNFVFIGLIQKIFPEAKIIHVERDGAATAWSLYKNYFTNANLSFCYDLRDITALYKEYVKMMSFWDTEQEGVTYTVNYELLTADKEKQIRSLIDHIGLAWEASCLKPHLNSGGVHTASMVQVRQPIYRNSSQAWKKFENYLPKNFSELSL